MNTAVVYSSFALSSHRKKHTHTHTRPKLAIELHTGFQHTQTLNGNFNFYLRPTRIHICRVFPTWNLYQIIHNKNHCTNDNTNKINITMYDRVRERKRERKLGRVMIVIFVVCMWVFFFFVCFILSRVFFSIFFGSV